MNFLVNERFLEVAIFLKENPQHVNTLIQKMHLTPISQFVENCMKLESSFVKEYPGVKWSEDLFKMVFAYSMELLENEKLDRFCFVSSFVSQSFRFNLYNLCPHLHIFLSSKMLRLLLPLLRNGLVFELVLLMIEYSKSNHRVFLQSFCEDWAQKMLSSVLENYSPIIPDKEGAPQKLTVARLNVIALISSLFRSPSSALEISCTKSGLLSSCLDLFFQFKLCNILHSHLTDIICGILNSGSSKLKFWLLSFYKLIDKLLVHRDQSDHTFRGFILKIFFSIKCCKVSNSNPNSYFNQQAVDYIDNHYDWDEIDKWITENQQTAWEKPKKTPISHVMSQLNNILQLLKMNKK